MGKSKGEEKVINLEDTMPQRGQKRKNEVSHNETPLKKHASSLNKRKGKSNKVTSFF
jgi:hypothetical protein